MRRIAGCVLADLVAGCHETAAPTPQIISMTGPPQPAPTPIVIPITPAPPPSGTGHTISGTLTLFGASNASLTVTPGGTTDCRGVGEYSAIRTGLPVSVQDQAGAILATGSLTFDGGHACQFGFALPDVPDAAFYSIKVGHFGAVSYSRDQLAAASWHVEFTLGKP